MGWLSRLGVGVADIHAHVRALQRAFLELLEALDLRALPSGALVTPRDLARQGHFLTFRLPDAVALAEALRAQGVDVDSRGDRLRFGFGLYHDPTTWTGWSSGCGSCSQGRRAVPASGAMVGGGHARLRPAQAAEDQDRGPGPAPPSRPARRSSPRSHFSSGMFSKFIP